MKKRFSFTNLDCANCAAKMEAAIGKFDGVRSVSVSYFSQKMTLEAEDARFDAILQEAAKICKKIEPDCVLHI